jgi:hypothetical protein
MWRGVSYYEVLLMHIQIRNQGCGDIQRPLNFARLQGNLYLRGLFLESRVDLKLFFDLAARKPPRLGLYLAAISALCSVRSSNRNSCCDWTIFLTCWTGSSRV